MNVDFNNLRLTAATTLDSLIKKLNSSIQHDGGDRVEVFASDIEEDLDDLRALMYALNAIYTEDDDSCKSMIDELQAEGGIAQFNKD